VASEENRMDALGFPFRSISRREEQDKLQATFLSEQNLSLRAPGLLRSERYYDWKANSQRKAHYL